MQIGPGAPNHGGNIVEDAIAFRLIDEEFDVCVEEVTFGDVDSFEEDCVEELKNTSGDCGFSGFLRHIILI